jgi:demethylmenaquinone methyltransferase/2-methoxy-6-polyprenyl-1,4-benzoquinol methylase
MIQRVVDSAPATVLDVATGTCAVAVELAERTDAWITGVDRMEAMLKRGQANVAFRNQQARVSLALGRAEHLPFPDAFFDALTFTYLMRYVNAPEQTLRELVRVVKPGGVIAGLDFSVPNAGALRLGWWLYTRAILPFAGGLFGGRAWFRVGRFLGPSISSFYRRHPLPSLGAMWHHAGLADVRHRPMSLGGGIVVWARRGGPRAGRWAPGHEAASASDTLTVR